MNKTALNILIVSGVLVVVVGTAWYRGGSCPFGSQQAETSEPVAVADSVQPVTESGEPDVADESVPEAVDAPEAIESAEATSEPAAASQPAALPRLVDLGADRCIPCKKMTPILEALREEYAGRAEIEFIDVWKNPQAGRKYGIRLIPTQIFYDRKGNEVWRHEGGMTKAELEAKLKELGA